MAAATALSAESAAAERPSRSGILRVTTRCLGTGDAFEGRATGATGEFSDIMCQMTDLASAIVAGHMGSGPMA